jgi:WD40 repeat protein
VLLWKLGANEPPTLLPHPQATTVVFDPSGEHLVSTAQDRTVNIWTRGGKPYRNLVAYGKPSGDPSFSKDGDLLAVGTADGLVEVWMSNLA